MSENIPHSLGGFRGAFESEHGRKPTEQEIWNAAIRSWRDLTKQKSDVAKERVVDLLLEYAGDNGYSHIDYADTMRHAAALLQSTALPDHPEQHLDMAAEIRDLFPVPAPCSALEPAWAEAMANPASVPAYVRACLDARPVGELTDGKPLPCPFCGHVGLEFKEGSTFRWIIAECGGCGASRGETRIQTFGEGTRDEWMADVQADAIQEWNTRAILAAARPQPVLEPLTPEQLEQEFCELVGLETGINSAAVDTKRALVWFKKGYRHGITQGGKV